MDPERKRTIRLVVALSAAVLLAVALVYTSFTAGTSDRQVGEVLKGAAGERTQLVGRVVAGSTHGDSERLDFVLEDLRDSDLRLAVTYSGQIPDPFARGREVLVKGKLEHGHFVAEHDSMVTKCPSKFSAEAEQHPQHVQLEE